jgi:putative DNA primase/helicase
MSAAASIARALRGKHISGGYLIRCPVASHGNGRGDRNPSLMIRDGDKPGCVLVHCYAGCEAVDVLAALRKHNLIGPEANGDGIFSNERINGHTSAPNHEPDAAALAIWQAGAAINSDHQAGRFLRARGITLSPPPSLRAATILHLDQYPLPAMVAAVQAPDRRVIAVQRTLIDPRGDRKAQVRIPRQTIGALGWGAIRLAAATDELGLAEGTEKALAAMQLFGVPCWSTLGASRMHRVCVPDTVSTLHIFVDNDDAGRAAAERTAHEHRHRRVALAFPPEQFKDWDDVTAAKAKERSAA